MCLFISMVMATFSYANIMEFKVNTDVSIYQASPNFTSNGWYLYTGNWDNSSEYFSLFKFDLTDLTNQLNPGDVLTINSLTFYSYQNYNYRTAETVKGNLYLGTDDSWTTATWNNYHSHVGSLITWTSLTPGNKWVTWDLTGNLSPTEFLSDNLITLVLDTDRTGGAGWYDFASIEWSNYFYNNDSYYSYLHIDYTIQQGGSTPVPEPSTIFLMGTGLIGIFGYRRKRVGKKNL